MANWKMHPATRADAKKLFDATRKAAERCAKSAVVVAPPSLYLAELASRAYAGAKIPFALQNAHAEAEGSFTGEISLSQGKEAGASYVIVGHAERRAMGESNETTQAKVAAALSLNMIPILCVGEQKRTDSGEHLDFIRAQLVDGLAKAGAKIKKIVIAYEPVWAIGASSAMTPHTMHEMSIYIRKTIIETYGSVGHTIKILYGGSINASNTTAMLREGGVRGLLVGRASVDSKEFAELLYSIETL